MQRPPSRRQDLVARTLSSSAIAKGHFDLDPEGLEAHRGLGLLLRNGHPEADLKVQARPAGHRGGSSTPVTRHLLQTGRIYDFESWMRCS